MPDRPRLDGLSPGWATHLGVLDQAGATVEPGDGCFIVRTAALPDFHWGNFVLVTGAEVDDPAPALGQFAAAFPDAAYVAVGLTRMPGSLAAWEAQGIEVELDDVLTTRTPPLAPEAPEGYVVRALGDDDWDRQVARDVAVNLASGEYDPVEHERFARGQAVWRREMSERGAAAFFGAFAGDDLVSDLGIIRCGSLARYHNVATDPAHQGRGLASHLLGVAARWSAERGCDTWVIVTESTNPAGRVYRRAGFALDVGMAQAYRRPPR